MSVGRRAFIIVGGGTAIGAGTYAWLKKLGYDVDPPPSPLSRKARPKAEALPHEPFDPVALGVLTALVDHLIPGDAEHDLPPAVDVGVVDYLVAAAKAPGLMAIRHNGWRSPSRDADGWT